MNDKQINELLQAIGSIPIVISELRSGMERITDYLSLIEIKLQQYNDVMSVFMKHGITTRADDKQFIELSERVNEIKGGLLVVADQISNLSKEGVK